MRSNVPSPAPFEEFASEYVGAARRCAALRDDGRFFGQDLVEKLYGIYAALLDGAKTANLTAVLDLKGAVGKHLIDSLIPVKLLSDRGILRPGARAVDVGCGAGFPSLPIAAACGGESFPEIEVTALDSTEKKAAHVRRTAEKTGLANVTAVCGRAEELCAANGPMREKFDLAAARAVSSLPALLELTAPFVKVGGFVAAYKGTEDETDSAGRAARTLGLVLREKIAYSLPGGDGRMLVLYEKVKNTPAAYPRKYAKIKSDPL